MINDIDWFLHILTKKVMHIAEKDNYYDTKSYYILTRTYQKPPGQRSINVYLSNRKKMTLDLFVEFVM